jgi:hypothetical protein
MLTIDIMTVLKWKTGTGFYNKMNEQSMKGHKQVVRGVLKQAQELSSERLQILF